MALSLTQDGFNMAMKIVNTFRPKYWKNEDYGNEQYVIRNVKEDSAEFSDLEDEVYDAQRNHGLYNFNTVSDIYRIQNPYTYAMFMLRKKYKMRSGYVYQQRRYKLIRRKHLNLALKYNCDGRRFGKPDCDYKFYATVPRVWDSYVLFVVQVLTNDEDDDDDEYDDDDEDDDVDEDDEDGAIECDRISDFYIEYIVDFE